MIKILLLSFLTSLSAFASAPSRGKHYYALDAGGHITYLTDRLSAPAGFASEVSKIAGLVRFRPGFSLGKNYYFEPSLGVVLPWQTSADGATKTFPFHLDFSVNAPLLSFLHARLGSGAYATATLGDGANVSLNNGGAGLFSTFGTAASLVLTLNLTVNAGLEVAISKRFSLLLDVYVLEVASSLRRRVHASAVLGVIL